MSEVTASEPGRGSGQDALRQFSKLGRTAPVEQSILAPPGVLHVMQ